MPDPSDDTLRTAVLAGSRLTLRPWEREDIPAVAAGMSSPGMHRFLSIPDPYTAADAAEYIGANLDGTIGELGRAMVDRESGAVVGSIAMRPGPRGPHQRTVELGYAVYADRQRRGYASEAVQLVSAHAFDHGFARVEIQCAVDNLGSAKTAMNGGFRYEGTRRRGLKLRDDTPDAALFARLADDPPGPVERGFAAFPDDGRSDGVIRLRVLEARDAAAYFEQEADEVTVGFAFSGEAPSRPTVQGICTRARLDWLVGSMARLAVEDLATGRFAGSVGVRLPGPPGVGGIGYAIHPAFRGRGYTGRALRLLVPWAFEAAGFARLELGAKADNIASQRAAAAGGFEPDGVRAARLRNPDGSYSDEVRYAAINPQTPRRISP